MLRVAGRLALILTALALALPAAAQANTDNTFKTVCSLASTNKGPSPQQFDPIVHPAVFPAGHLHEFFGQTNIGPRQTGFAIMNRGAAIHTTCRDRFDTAAYWVPVLYRDAGFGPERVVPLGIDAYYQRIIGLQTWDGRTLTADEVPPTDFRLIDGNHDATAPQPHEVVKWQCLGNSNGGPGATPPACPEPKVNGPMAAMLNFPGCWDGGTDRLANGMNNVVAMRINGTAVCPAGHDHPIPRIILSVHYGVAALPDCHRVSAPQIGINCVSYALSEQLADGTLDDNGSIYGMHADFLNGWSRTLDTSPGDRIPDDFLSLIASCDNAPDHSTGCDEVATATVPPGDAFVPITR